MLRMLLCAVVAVGLLPRLADAVRCSDNPKPCGFGQYCINHNDGVRVVCVECNPACNGCDGPNEDHCVGICAAGYKRTGFICSECNTGEFGVNCTGICHCLDNEQCRKTDGHCEVWKCARGWKEPPSCQKQCDNNTFGLDCSSACHCPDQVSCNSVNGLCAGGVCDPDYGGPSCQIRLPKLVNVPEVTSVSCGQANVTWLRWSQEVDLGEGPVALYRLYREVNDSGVWQLVTTQTDLVGRTYYYYFMSDLQPDINYRFRVDINRKDGNKMMNPAIGFESDSVFIPCSETTQAPTTTTTVRSIIGLKVFEMAEPTLLANGSIRMSWRLTSNATNLRIPFNITLYYQEVGIGDCAAFSGDVKTVPVTTVPTGSLDITGLIPWRVYALTMEAYGEALNITDRLERRISSMEIAPTGRVSNIGTRDLMSRSVTITWIDVTCAERGGTFVQFNVQLTTTGSTRTDAVNITLINYDSLSPYTRYNVTVGYENTKGLGPISSEFSFTTDEEAPGPMSITGTTATTTTIRVNFNPPSQLNGQLIEYGITYSDKPDYSQQKTETFPAPKSFIVIDSLRAYTRYYIRMRARTNAGFGPYTNNVSITTQQDIPASPTSLTLVHKNETCLSVTWQPPTLTNGPLESYRITYSMTSEDGIDTVDTVSETVTTYTHCDYEPGKLYLFKVAARNGRGFGPDASSSFWTEQGAPRTPPAPVFVNATYSSILIEIEPVIPTSGPITRYHLRIELIGLRKRRDTIPGSVTAVLSPSDVTQRRLFEIGDGRTYGGTVNKPLERERRYNVYYVVESSLNGLTKTSYSRMKDPALTAPPPAVTTAPPPVGGGGGGDNTGLIVGIIVGVLLLLLLILLILLFLWWRRRNKPPPYKPYNNLNSYDMPVVKDDYNPEKYWNTTYSTRESRYIVAGREYLPDEQITMNGEAIVNPGAEPVTFKAEFKSLPHEFKDPIVTAKEYRNKHKNRFPHLLPYDKSRVVLYPDDNCGSDYINASYISGYKKQMAYIAAQSPFDEDTVLDFWRMISQKEIKTIVMITNIVEDHIVKCTQYWPEDGRASYGTFLLELLDMEVFASYTIRVVAYQTADNIKGSVRIFDFTSWPEHGVPFDPIPLLEMRHKVRRVHMNERSPILVHCGTGMGRTGVFIAIDSLIEQYRIERRTSVYAFLKKIRRDRPYMVRTLKEYVFIYEALFDEFHAGETLVGLDLKDWYHDLTMRNKKTGHSYLKGQFRLLENYTRRPQTDQCHTALLAVNYNKNRFPDVVPLESYRPLLRTPGGVGRTDYINATFLDGFHVKNQFILTQSPLHTTIVDFWKLVYDYDVNTIVMMENFKYEDDTCAEYWPTANMKPFEPFFVETTATYQEDNVTIRNFKIQNSHKPEEAPKFVRLFQFNGWDEPNVVPTSKTLILDLLGLVNDWQYKTNENTRPIIVHCRDGATHSGLFCALSVICDKISADEEVDVFHTIKHMKRRRAQIVAYPEQLRFCYKTLWDYINLRLIPEGGFTETFDGTKSPQYSLSLTSFYDTLYSN